MKGGQVSEWLVFNLNDPSLPDSSPRGSGDFHFAAQIHGQAYTSGAVLLAGSRLALGTTGPALRLTACSGLFATGGAITPAKVISPIRRRSLGFDRSSPIRIGELPLAFAP